MVLRSRPVALAVTQSCFTSRQQSRDLVFHVKKWLSNAEINSPEGPEQVILGAENHSEKVLGTVWLTKSDQLTLKVRLELTNGKDLATFIPVKLTKWLIY